MKILYINNFRGFKETFIPFEDVNFFVGENSTGKSSVLSILRLMSNLQFWNTDDFNTSDVELGFFSELVSKNSKINSSFQLGYTVSEDDQRRQTSFRTILVTYMNDKGSPKMSEVRLAFENLNILIRLGSKQYRFFIKQTDYQVQDQKSFQQWVSDVDFTEITYKIYSPEDELSFRTPFYEIRRFLRSELPKSFKLEGISRPEFLPYSTWIAPIRSKPKRIYESFKLIFSSEGDHTPLLIKGILADQYKKNITKEAFSKAMEKFGKQSGLFDKIEVENLGKDMSSPFVLNVYLNGTPLKITNVGYGVGQVLPLLADILVTYDGRWFSIQQPEVHLHPKAQAALGEFLYNSASEHEKHFLIETHSDFLIDRFRYSLKSGKRKPSSQVLFFERTKNGNRVSRIDIDRDGQYSEDQPRSFREFFINEELNLLSI